MRKFLALSLALLLVALAIPAANAQCAATVGTFGGSCSVAASGSYGAAVIGAPAVVGVPAVTTVVSPQVVAVQSGYAAQVVGAHAVVARPVVVARPALVGAGGYGAGFAGRFGAVGAVGVHRNVGIVGLAAPPRRRSLLGGLFGSRTVTKTRTVTKSR